MELPEHLKSLYRHWSKHASHQYNTPTTIAGVNTDILRGIETFIAERMHIWEQKTNGQPAPYTTDPILRDYRFCNIFRELDRQTIEYHELLAPICDDFPLWLLNMFAARLIARPATLREIWLLGYDREQNEVWLARLRALPQPRYGTPYVFPVSTILQSNTPDRETFMARYLPTIIPRITKEIETWQDMSVYDGVERILPIFSFRHSFLWTEVLIDTAYQYPDRIDLFARFPIGPGALPTLRRLAPDLDPSIVVTTLAGYPSPPLLTHEWRPIPLSAENWEGIACEWRKYVNLKNGGGRKRKFTERSNSDTFLDLDTSSQ